MLARWNQGRRDQESKKMDALRRGREIRKELKNLIRWKLQQIDDWVYQMGRKGESRRWLNIDPYYDLKQYLFKFRPRRDYTWDDIKATLMKRKKTIQLWKLISDPDYHGLSMELSYKRPSKRVCGGRGTLECHLVVSRWVYCM